MSQYVETCFDYLPLFWQSLVLKRTKKTNTTHKVLNVAGNCANPIPISMQLISPQSSVAISLLLSCICMCFVCVFVYVMLLYMYA